MRLRNIATVTAGLLVLATAACGGQSTDSQAGRNGGSGGPAPANPPVLSAKDYKASLFADSAKVDHPWYPLTPGTKTVYKGHALEDGKRVRHGVVSIVTDMTRRVDGVRNIVVWERDYAQGKLVEGELALWAQDRYGNVWHMGEFPQEYENGKVVKAPAWVHGFKGAYAGILIPAHPSVGTPGYQEGYAPPPINWVDHGIVHRTGVRTCVPAGCYDHVVVVAEYDPDAPGAFQDKYYAPGVGVVRVGWRGNDEDQEVLRLVKVEKLTGARLAAANRGALAMQRSVEQSSADVLAHTQPAPRLAD